jgi:hypothetical protein
MGKLFDYHKKKKRFKVTYLEKMLNLNIDQKSESYGSKNMSLCNQNGNDKVSCMLMTMGQVVIFLYCCWEVS